MAAILVLLAIVPHTQKEKELEEKTKKILQYALITVAVLLALAAFQFRDSLWQNTDNIELIESKVRVYDEHSKKLSITNYELKNISAQSLDALLDSREDIKHLTLTNLSAENATVVAGVINSSQHISELRLYRIPSKVFKVIFTNLSPNVGLEIITLDRCKISDENANILATYLGQSKTIKQLNLFDDSISEFAIAMLMDLDNVRISHAKKGS